MNIFHFIITIILFNFFLSFLQISNPQFTLKVVRLSHSTDLEFVIYRETGRRLYSCIVIALINALFQNVLLLDSENDKINYLFTHLTFIKLDSDNSCILYELSLSKIAT